MARHYVMKDVALPLQEGFFAPDLKHQTKSGGSRLPAKPANFLK